LRWFNCVFQHVLHHPSSVVCPLSSGCFSFLLSSAREVFLGLWNRLCIPPGLGLWNQFVIPAGLGPWNQLPLFQRAAYFTGLLSQFQLSI
jgi:hypothetical protein